MEEGCEIYHLEAHVEDELAAGSFLGRACTFERSTKQLRSFSELFQSDGALPEEVVGCPLLPAVDQETHRAALQVHHAVMEGLSPDRREQWTGGEESTCSTRTALSQHDDDVGSGGELLRDRDRQLGGVIALFGDLGSMSMYLLSSFDADLEQEGKETGVVVVVVLPEARVEGRMIPR